ncbi:MAG: outer membrane beta-barrel protein [Candidatus Eisenbacteria bacterium]
MIRRLLQVLCVVLLVLCVRAPFAEAAMGKLQGRLVSSENGEPIGYADLSLIPADTTLKRVGALSNADGTFLLIAAPGLYTLQVRAMSYTRKRVEGVLLSHDAMREIVVTLAPQAIEQKETLVEARLRQNTENALLAARRRSNVVGDAVSAEQVRRSPDKDAAEVLRRVTGLSVSDGKYVFVRGLGERYSSTEVDGVRLASPEQNKRVVPLDLLPANLLENIVVQKTYTADRPGEFGGGDVQVRTRDFPGARTWSFSASQGWVQGVTGHERLTYAATSADRFGFGVGARELPGAVLDVIGNRRLIVSNNPEQGFRKSVVAQLAGAFRNVWSAARETARPNSSYSATYGDEFKLFGRSLGLIESWSLSTGYDDQRESQRFFMDRSDTLYDYAVRRSTESVQLGGISGLSYRLSPSHALHLRGLYTNHAEDEVRTYEGPDHNRTDADGNWLQHRSTRLMYVQRDVLSGTLEGQHDFPGARALHFDWKFTRSRAERNQPDRREVTYDRWVWDDGNGPAAHWLLGSNGVREFGRLRDDGWGTTLSSHLPVNFGRLGKGRFAFGYDRQTKQRANAYRRFNLHPNENSDYAAPPESLFAGGQFDSTLSGGWIEETTLDIDNYAADQRVEAGYASLDVPLGPAAKAYVGVRLEHGVQDVRTFDLFEPSKITAHGHLDDTDVLPTFNLSWSVTRALAVKLGASRTLSRPDLNEMSPSPALEYVGGYRVAGNPRLERAMIDNYDLRFEAFPSLSEVFAAGVFYKRLHDPIEQVIQAGTPPMLVPMNSDHGRNVGLELEARTSLGRLAPWLQRLSVNANASLISSRLKLRPQLTRTGSSEHPLQGQAAYLVNASLVYAVAPGHADVSVLWSATGERLRTLGMQPLPDVYEQPFRTLDAAFTVVAPRGLRLKLAGRNLLDGRHQLLQGGKEVSGWRTGRSASLALSWGS